MRPLRSYADLSEMFILIYLSNFRFEHTVFVIFRILACIFILSVYIIIICKYYLKQVAITASIVNLGHDLITPVVNHKADSEP